jgi:threonine dehydratase
MELGCRSVTVSDASILAAMRRLFDQSHLVVEPSGAAALAALLDHGSGGAGTDAVVLSGGNVSFERFTRLLAEAPA